MSGRRKKKLTPAEKLVAGAVGVAIFPLMLTLETYKQSQKKKRSKKNKTIFG